MRLCHFLQARQLLVTSWVIVAQAPWNPGTAVEVQGRVTDAANRRAIEAANVYLAGGNEGAPTTSDGRFKFETTRSGRDTLWIDHVAYEPKHVVLQLNASPSHDIRAELEPRRIDVAQVIVTATRQPQAEFRSEKAVGVVEATSIEQRSASSTADALRETAGVVVQKTTAGHGAPIIRGLIGKNILLLYNGVRLNRPTFRPGGNQYLNTVEADDLTRMEVVRGPGAVLYGSDAVGGVVNLVTSPPAFSAQTWWSPGVRLRYTSGDNGRSAHLGFSGAGKNASARASLTGKMVGNLEPGGNLPPHDPTGYDGLSAFAQAQLRLPGGSRLRIDALTVHQPRVPRYDKYASGDFEEYVYSPQNRSLALLRWEREPGTRWVESVRLTGALHHEREGRRLRRAGQEARQHDDDRILAGSLSLEGVSRWKSGHSTLWGFDLSQDYVSSSRHILDAGTRRETRATFPDGSTARDLGLFASQQAALPGDGRLNLGMRRSFIWRNAPLEAPFSPYAEHFAPWTFSLGANLPLRRSLALVGSAAQSFRAPDFNDTVVLKSSDSGIDAPNPDLDPERSMHYELGLKYAHPRAHGELFIYRSDLRDLIVERPGTYLGLDYLDQDGDGERDPNEPSIYTKQNADQAWIQGVETSGSWDWNQAWTTRWHFTWTFGQNVTGNEPLRRIPPANALLGFRWTQAQHAFDIWGRAADSQRRLSTGDVEDPRIAPGGTPGFMDLSIRYRRDLGAIHLSATLGNLFDAAYKEHGSGVHNPGRHCVLTLNWSTARP